MSSWQAYNLKMVPGVPDILNMIRQLGNMLTEVLNAVKTILDASATLLGLIADAVESAISIAIAALQTAIDEIYNLMNTGVYSYTDESLLWKNLDNGGDGVEGFMARWVESFDDTGNSDRPQFSDSADLLASLYVIGVNDLPSLGGLLDLIGQLFNIPSLVWMADKIELDIPARIEGETSTPPDWTTKNLLEVLKPLGQLMELLKDAAGLLTLGSSLAALLDALVAAITIKIETIQAIIEKIDSFVALLIALIENAGIYMLSVRANGIPNLKAEAYAAERPPLNDNAYVVGGCMLVGTADGITVLTNVLGL